MGSVSCWLEDATCETERIAIELEEEHVTLLPSTDFAIVLQGCALAGQFEQIRYQSHERDGKSLGSVRQ